MKLIQWNSDAYDQDLVERTSDSCQGKVDVVVGCLGLGAPLQRSFKCLRKGGTVFVTEDINDKVLKSLQKLADQQNVNIGLTVQHMPDVVFSLNDCVVDI